MQAWIQAHKLAVFSGKGDIMKSFFARAASVLLSAALIFNASFGAAEKKTASAEAGAVTFVNFPESVNGGEPIRGVDVSSIISVEKSGVRFYDDRGREEDIFKILHDHGVNYIRVRIWNEPNDGKGHSYGGGNSDLDTAAEIARRASKYGMKMLVDIHYSDFWADPEKQTRPKYWAQHSHDVLKGEIYKWTTWVVKVIDEAGGNIGMVQVGNETNCFFCGEKDMYKICDLFASANKAIRDYDRNILIAHHFANPSNADHYLWYAKVMNECKLDYDVFATSYYPYWHGTTENMTSVLKNIANTYNKYVMVAETAYPYTNEDGDGFGNTISSYSQGVDLNYDISVEGQTKALTDVFQAVADVGEKGLGVFYWEPAWLGEYNVSRQKQRENWEKYGSGWATAYASGYDKNAAETGGSSFDNQALFDFSGHPLSSLDVFSRVYPNKQPSVHYETAYIGDLNKDGKINVYDLCLLKRVCFAAKSSRMIPKELCDLNADSEITTADIVLMQQYLFGRIGSFPAGIKTELPV